MSFLTSFTFALSTNSARRCALISYKPGDHFFLSACCRLLCLLQVGISDEIRFVSPEILLNQRQNDLNTQTNFSFHHVLQQLRVYAPFVFIVTSFLWSHFKTQQNDSNIKFDQ